MDKEFDINKIRETFGELAHTINWYQQRGGLLPYDWISYGHPHIAKLVDLLKMDFDGSLKSKDKKGSWRVMKKLTSFQSSTNNQHNKITDVVQS